MHLLAHVEDDLFAAVIEIKRNFKLNMFVVYIMIMS